MSPNKYNVSDMQAYWRGEVQEDNSAIHVIEANQDSSTVQHAKPDNYQCHEWFFKPELQTLEASPAKTFFMDDGL